MSAQTSTAISEPKVRTPAAPLSLRLWDLDWGPLFPRQLVEGVSVEHGTFDQATPFIQEHYGEIFGFAESGFLQEPSTEAKRRFFAEADTFLFRAEEKTIGILIGHPTDWSTYYLRTAAFVREYRARGLMQAFLAPFWPALRAAGVARVQSEVSACNSPTIGLHLKEGFVFTSSTNSERWGAIVCLTKFLTPESGGVFQQKFCSMPTRTTAFRPELDRSRS